VSDESERLRKLLGLMFQAHPWHGISTGDAWPEAVTAYIELVPTDPVKYELDKTAGHLRIDRPQRFSSYCPTPYGFIPQTYCGTTVAQRTEARAQRQGLEGDGDPLDICVLTEKTIAHGAFLLRALPIGGLRMIDGNQADDKVVAVLEGDLAYGHLRDITELPRGVLDRLRHYFLTYKQIPNEGPRKVEITEVYDRAEAHEVVRRSVRDYCDTIGDPAERFRQLRDALSGA
jgi:inorganic pyrophosphatase